MKTVTAQEAISGLKDGMTLMVGGFMSCGTPQNLMDAIVEKGAKDLTVIGNDAGYPNNGIGKLVTAGLVKKLVASHIGLNPDVAAKMNDGSIEVVLVPQGTLAEQIRAGGAGLGGVLTPTGLGTEVATGKQTVTVDGVEYLLEKPLKADMAFLRASVADEDGNVFYKGTTRNFNPLMATAAETVVVGTEEVVPVGDISGELVMTPGIFVDYVVGGES